MAKLKIERVSGEAELDGGSPRPALLKHVEFLAQHSSISMWVSFPSGEVEFCNEYWFDYTGLTAEECLGSGWMKAIHSEDLYEYLGAWKRGIEKSIPVEAVFRLRRAGDGAYRSHLTRAAPAFDKAGNVTHWLGTCIDIEEEDEGEAAEVYAVPSALRPGTWPLRPGQIGTWLFSPGSENKAIQRQAEEAAERVAQQRYRVMSANAPGMIYQFLMTPAGEMRFVFASSGSRMLFGIEPEEIEEDINALVRLIAPENMAAFHGSIMISAQNLSPWVWDGWAVVATGQRKWITCSSVPQRKSNGEIVWDGLLMDSTAAKLSQIQIEMQRLQLEESNLRLSELNRKLDIQATHDALTGLKNRRFFEGRLNEEAHRSERMNKPFSVLLLDIDHFKQFNDTFGHKVGDDVLRTVGELLRESVRDIDCAARYGGEEFVIILSAANEAAGMTLAERLRVIIESHPWPDRQVTASMGLATRFPHRGGTLEGLIKAADEALYESKAKGRNRVTLSHYGLGLAAVA